ncbi:MAG: hypothetical protein HY360_19550 [Verrucomicrobia bacterium]|nr:hypothetical protein [Verrucomicrobiota bacterium]
MKLKSKLLSYPSPLAIATARATPEPASARRDRYGVVGKPGITAYESSFCTRPDGRDKIAFMQSRTGLGAAMHSSIGLNFE